MSDKLWENCLFYLENELSEQQLNTWIKPLHVIEDTNNITLLAPNRFVKDWVTNKFYKKIQATLSQLSPNNTVNLVIKIGSQNTVIKTPSINTIVKPTADTANHSYLNESRPNFVEHNLNPFYTFDNFVEGKSNQLARAASLQVAKNPGNAYNPLFFYGGTGLGKTHLMHAVGNSLLENNPNFRITYIHSEKFVAHMVKALQHKTINAFKEYYRSLDAILVDDIQFFAGKEGTQDEFFHTFNSLFESGSQIILTCDRYPKEVKGLEERLRSRFGWGLPVCIEPPELETRVAILQKKAEEVPIELPNEVAFYIAKNIRSNTRDLEGAFRRVVVTANFLNSPITLESAKETLRDLVAMGERSITIENIQKTVADHYKIQLSDILSNRRSRSITRPRQLAMALTKDLTNHSFPEIGAAFGGRDHTTILHGCKKIIELRNSDTQIDEAYRLIYRILSN